jgi:hypothetical protein
MYHRTRTHDLWADKEQDQQYDESEDEGEDRTAGLTARARLLMSECCKQLHVRTAPAPITGQRFFFHWRDAHPNPRGAFLLFFVIISNSCC